MIFISLEYIIIITSFYFFCIQSDLDELLNEAKNSEEKAKKAMVDAARLADELRAEQDHAQTQEKLRKALETQIKELQVRTIFSILVYLIELISYFSSNQLTIVIIVFR